MNCEVFDVRTFTPPWAKEITPAHSVLAVIDMQKFFTNDPKSAWKDPAVLSITPNIKDLIEATTRGATIFTLFKPPVDWQDDQGNWKNYYHHSIGVTGDQMNPKEYEVIDAFKDEMISPLTRSISKTTASAFYAEEFAQDVKDRRATFLILCGIETDYCVLATAIDAVSRGYCVVIPMDACGSSRGEAGQKNAEAIFERFGGQIWVTDTKTVTAQLAGETS